MPLLSGIKALSYQLFWHLTVGAPRLAPEPLERSISSAALNFWHATVARV
jgi:hypothetical protein